MADERKISVHQGGDTKPVPDPTTLTDKLVEKATLSLRELLEARFDAKDARYIQFHQEFDRLPELIKEKVSNLKELNDERFRSIQTQFQERDTRTEQYSRDRDVAVAAALSAAKEAVKEQDKASKTAIDKSEAATNKEIDGIKLLINTTTAAANDKVDDLKARIALIEGRGSGAQNLWGYLCGGFGLVGIIIGIVMALSKG